MVEAKPRVFTDIPWIRSQDDMQLLRAIKYGVPGTAMVAWGDQTGAAQRMALVLFIRNLSRASLAREELQEVLFDCYESKLMLVEEAQIETYRRIDALKTALHATHEELSSVDVTKVAQEHVGGLYLTTRKLEQEVRQAEESALTYQKLMQLLKEEKALYAGLGETLLAGESAQLKEDYFDFVRLEPLEYRLQEGKLRVAERATPIANQFAENEAMREKLEAAAELRRQQLNLSHNL